ncbi:PucR family transcriptional regulator [Crossiella equi]|uniref:PucR family transcriptional regulator n=1 Tax=Crossiella equi TaxID=130796 RepID=UPI00355847EF
MHATRPTPPGELDRTEAATQLSTPLVALTPTGLRALTPARPPHALHTDPRWLTATSAPTRWQDLPTTNTRTTHLLTRAKAEGRSLLEAPTTLDTLLPPESATHFAATVLTPLQPHPALLTTLRAWLAANGNWETTATTLNLHRNTIRHRIATIERTLPCDLSNPDTRTELWLALRWLPPTPGVAEGPG